MLRQSVKNAIPLTHQTLKANALKIFRIAFKSIKMAYA